MDGEQQTKSLLVNGGTIAHHRKEDTKDSQSPQTKRLFVRLQARFTPEARPDESEEAKGHDNSLGRIGKVTKFCGFS